MNNSIIKTEEFHQSLICVQDRTPMALVKALREQCTAARLPWGISVIPYSVESVDLTVERAAGRNMVAIVGYLGDAKTAAMCQRLPIPCINISGNGWLPPGGACVTVDQYAIGRLAAQFANRRGFKHALCVNPTDLPLERISGFIDTFKALHGSVHLVDHSGRPGMLSRQHNAAERVATIVDILKKLPKPLCCFFHTDYMVEHWYTAIDLAKIPVPGEVVFLAADNNREYCNSLQPTLSSVDMPATTWAGLITRTLQRLMAGSAESEVITCQPRRIVERQSTAPTATHPVLRKALSYIRRHHRQATVPLIAAHCKTSTASIYRLFKEQFYTTANGFITQCHLHQAEHLLHTTDKSNKTIAKESGFGTERRFYAVFMEHHGMSPGAWKRHVRANRTT